MQHVAARVRRQHGYELTPAQVAENLNKSIATIREKMVEAGHPEFSTMSDEEVYLVIRESAAK